MVYLTPNSPQCEITSSAPAPLYLLLMLHSSSVRLRAWHVQLNTTYLTPTSPWFEVTRNVVSISVPAPSYPLLVTKARSVKCIYTSTLKVSLCWLTWKEKMSKDDQNIKQWFSSHYRSSRWKCWWHIITPFLFLFFFFLRDHEEFLMTSVLLKIPIYTVSLSLSLSHTHTHTHTHHHTHTHTHTPLCTTLTHTFTSSLMQASKFMHQHSHTYMMLYMEI